MIPLWRNALTFLNYLDEASLIKRNAADARIGQFLLVKGSLVVMDLTLFKGIWQMPMMKNAILSGANINPQAASHLAPQNRQQRRSSGRGSGHLTGIQKDTDSVDAGLSLIGLLPHAIQARLSVEGADQMVWTSLRDDSLVVSAADLTLKHGTARCWHVEYVRNSRCISR
jgi:hypothetical protein